ncbi:MAG: DUF488 family protein [Betaproteobacteria bacterium]
MTASPLIYTVGHSTRTLDDLVSLLRANGVARLADVRSIPRSRRHPHFSREALVASLPAAGVAYLHMPALGGLRKPRRESTNTAWQHPGFRGYADYMQTSAFERALADLLAWAEPGTTAVMCAEAVWWRCHRQLIADALVARGIEVRHIMEGGAAQPHKLTAFARVSEGRVTYPSLLDHSC